MTVPLLFAVACPRRKDLPHSCRTIVQTSVPSRGAVLSTSGERPTAPPAARRAAGRRALRVHRRQAPRRQARSFRAARDRRCVAGQGASTHGGLRKTLIPGIPSAPTLIGAAALVAGRRRRGHRQRPRHRLPARLRPRAAALRPGQRAQRGQQHQLEQLAERPGPRGQPRLPARGPPGRRRPGPAGRRREAGQGAQRRPGRPRRERREAGVADRQERLAAAGHPPASTT